MYSSVVLSECFFYSCLRARARVCVCVFNRLRVVAGIRALRVFWAVFFFFLDRAGAFRVFPFLVRSACPPLTSTTIVGVHHVLVLTTLWCPVLFGHNILLRTLGDSSSSLLLYY